MTENEITDYVMSYLDGETGLEAVGPVLKGLVSFISYQEDKIADLEKRLTVLERE